MKDGDPLTESEVLAQKAAAIRQDVESLLADRRRPRSALAKLRRNPVFAIGAAALIGFAGYGLSRMIGRSLERRHTLWTRLGSYREAARRAARKPNSVAKEQPNLALKIAASAASAMAATFAKKAALRMMAQR